MNIPSKRFILCTIIVLSVLNPECSHACPLCGKSNSNCSCNIEFAQILDWINKSKAIRSHHNSEKKLLIKVIGKPVTNHDFSTIATDSSQVSTTEASGIAECSASGTATDLCFPHGYPAGAHNIQFIPPPLFSGNRFSEVLSNALLIVMNIPALETVLSIMSTGHMPDLTTEASGYSDWLSLIDSAYMRASSSSKGAVFFGRLSNGIRLIVIINSNGHGLYLSWSFDHRLNAVSVTHFSGLEQIDGVVNTISSITANSVNFVTVGYFLIEMADIN
jgi:hypothetical protein